MMNTTVDTAERQRFRVECSELPAAFLPVEMRRQERGAFVLLAARAASRF